MTDWESMYQQDDKPWEKGAPCPGLVDFLAHETVSGRVLVPGCGFGHDVRALATPSNEVVGLDIAPSAIKGARSFSPIAGERYELADLFDLPQEIRGTFDWVWEHTCFCAIARERRVDYVNAVAGALKPGGHLLAIFYIDPGNDSPTEGPPFEVSIPQLDALFNPHFALVREWLPKRAYRGREGREWMRLLLRR
jgi:SAM-dependent methyltransferase